MAPKVKRKVVVGSFRKAPGVPLRLEVRETMPPGPSWGVIVLATILGALALCLVWLAIQMGWSL